MSPCLEILKMLLNNLGQLSRIFAQDTPENVLLHSVLKKVPPILTKIALLYQPNRLL